MTRMPRGSFSSGLLSGRRFDAFGLQTLDDGIEPTLLDLGAILGTEVLHVADSLNRHVPGFPTLVGLAHAVVHRHARAIAALDLGAYSRAVGRGIALKGQYPHPIRGEIGERGAVVFKQGLV